MIIRNFRKDDSEKCYQNFGQDVSLGRYLTMFPMRDIHEMENLIADFFENSSAWVIEEKVSHEPIGYISLDIPYESLKIGEIGYVLGEKYQHRGYALEALKTMIPYFFKERKLYMIEAKYNENNRASARLLSKLGFKIDGSLRERRLDPETGKRCNLVICSLTQNDKINDDINDAITEPAELVRLELKNAGFDIDNMNTPKRVFLLADSLYDVMLSRNCGKFKYPLGGELYVFNENENVGFIKSHMCSPAIATQAEDLIAGGVKELIHIGFAGGLQPDMKPGDVVLTDGAYNDTAVARLYGFDSDVIESSKGLTNELCELLEKSAIKFRRGKHWTTDAGYRETWGQIIEHREKGALCVEMEGVGLFTIANYRKCAASAIYVISDLCMESGWDLGWGENRLAASIDKLIDMMINTAAE